MDPTSLEIQLVSEFARVLKTLLVDSSYHTIPEWSEILNVTVTDFDKWFTDKAIPSPGVLSSIMDYFYRFKDIPAPVFDFERISIRPSEEISPFHEQIGLNLNSYMVSGLLKCFVHDLNLLPYKIQEYFILRSTESTISFFLSGDMDASKCTCGSGAGPHTPICKIWFTGKYHELMK